MKIGHLTFHASHNYGSVLQAYALSATLQKLGHEVEVINLRPPSQKKAYQIFRKTDIPHFLFTLFLYPQLKKRFAHYERFIHQTLPITTKEYASTEELKNASLHYDAYVWGGDQIWNPICQDFETAYYLEHLSQDDPSIKISYSPSFGKSTFDEPMCEQIGGWAQKFDALSVREQEGAMLLQTYARRQAKVVCDPVLLRRNEWKDFAVLPKTKKPYLLTYFLQNNHGSREMLTYFQKQTGFEVINLNEYISDYGKNYKKSISASPEEFVGLFLNASLIYTNSFHGTVFATMFEKPFYTAIARDQVNAKNNNDSRKIHYLKRLKLTHRLVGEAPPPKEALLQVDYQEANQILDSFCQESLDFLQNALRR